MATKTVRVSNISAEASEYDLKEFFSFSGEIEHIEMHSDDADHQIAYVMFKDAQGAETAALLSGGTIVNQPIIIALAPDYELPAAAKESMEKKDSNDGVGSAVHKAEDVVRSMLAKGFILGKDALNKARAFDEKHQFTSTATATVTSLDQKIGLSDKISAGTTMVNEKVREVDEKFQVSEKTKSAIAAAEQTASSAGSAIMKNRYVLTGVSWVTGAYNKVAKGAGEAGQKAEDKVSAEDGQERKT